MEWDISYRKGDAGEIEAVVEAVTEAEAIQQFLDGNVKSVKVNYWVLQPDFVEASRRE